MHGKEVPTAGALSARMSERR